MLAVAALAVGAYLIVHLNDEIRREVERVLAEHYTSLEVEVGDARLIEGRGIEIRNLALRPRGSDGGEALLEVEEVFLACPVQVKQLLRGLPPLTRVVVRRPHLRVVADVDGTWNVGALLPLPKPDSRPVPLVVQRGILEVAADPASPEQRITFRGLQGAIRPATQQESAENGSGDRPEFVFAITASGPLCRKIEFQGRFDPQDAAMRMTGDLKELTLNERDLAGLSQSLRAQGAAWVADSFRGLEQLRGSVCLRSLEFSASPASRVRLSAAVQLAGVEIRHASLPDPITKLGGEVAYQKGELHASGLHGRCGSASFALSFRRRGVPPLAPWTLSAQLANVDLEQRHWQVLPASLQDVWQKYRPHGVIDIPRCELVYDAGDIRPHVEVTCRDVSILAEKFRYPLQNVRGSVVILPPAGRGERGRVELQLEGRTTGQTPVKIDGQFAVDTSLAAPPSEPVGWLRVTGSGVAVDEPLVAALPEAAERFVRELRPQGQIGFVYEATRQNATQAEPDKQLELTLQGGTVHYQRFPYPLHNVRGEVYARNGHWNFQSLTADTSSGQVSCRGSLEPPIGDVVGRGGVARGSAGGPRLALDFDATLDLDSTLRQALAVLSQDAQATWDALEPSGRIAAAVTVRQVLGNGPPEIEHTIEPVERSVSIKPRFFPYRIDQLEGRVHFDGRRARFEKLRGRHEPTTIAASGVFQNLGGGGWSLQLDDLSVDRLSFDKELLTAMPAGLARLVTRLNPQGQISLGRSSVQFHRAAYAEPIDATWQLNFDVHQASLDCGVQLENVSGEVRLAGHGRGDEFTTDGELSIDSVRWKQFFAGNVEGPLYADTKQVLLGERACLARGIPPRRVTAEAYGGKATGDAAVTIGPSSRFAVSAEYQAGDLRRLITETWPTQENVRGEIYGRIDLQGMSGSPETIRGEGAVALRNAELYELPQLIRLFKVLRGHEPDRTAFTHADAEFDVAGRHVGLKRLSLSGDALALHGRGTVDFDQRLNLTFYSELAPTNSSWGGLRSLIRQASNQVMRLHVHGSIAEPQFTPEPLAGLNDALQQIQQEFDAQARLPAAPRGARNPLAPPWR